MSKQCTVTLTNQAHEAPASSGNYMIMCYIIISFQVKIPNFQSRYFHRAAAFSIGPELTEVVIFGGAFKFLKDRDYKHEDPFLSITVLQFSESIIMCSHIYIESANALSDIIISRFWLILF